MSCSWSTLKNNVSWAVRSIPTVTFYMLLSVVSMMCTDFNMCSTKTAATFNQNCIFSFLLYSVIYPLEFLALFDYLTKFFSILTIRYSTSEHSGYIQFNCVHLGCIDIYTHTTSLKTYSQKVSKLLYNFTHFYHSKHLHKTTEHI